METDVSDIYPLIEHIVEKEFRHRGEPKFIPGKTYIPSSGHVYGHEEVNEAIRTILGGKWNEGKQSHEFEQSLAHFSQRRFATFCNAGSSANLLGLAAMTSKKMGSRRLRPGMEVVTSAVGFPTTVNAILQLGLIPVFVDISIPSYNAKPDMVEEAFSKKTGAVMLAHTLGNPVNIDKILQACDGCGLWSLFDCCDGLGGTYKDKPLTSYGDVSTLSFYPAHHITTVEGGMVLSDSGMMDKAIRSFRDWGRDCWCNPGCDNTCGIRFEHDWEDLPHGYDHKYVYSEVGYNLKSTDIQASIGNAQFKRLPRFVELRQQNWDWYYEALDSSQSIYSSRTLQGTSSPSWFGFALTLRDDVAFTRNELTQYLENHKIGTRNLFGSNLLRQPAYKDVPKRVVGAMRYSDIVTERTFWLGVYPEITQNMQDYTVSIIADFIKGHK